MFSRNFYRFGLLGQYIGLVHLVARLHGQDPRRILEANSRDQQRWIFDNTLSQVFNSKIVRWVCNMPVSIYGLGIPPNQFNELKSASASNSMADVLHERLENLACEHDIKDNYFAWQAFGRCYDTTDRVAVPRYLQEQHYDNLRDRIGNVEIKNANIEQHLATCAPESQDGYILLDAQDWMNDDQLNALWSEIDRTAKVGARVIFRTAGKETILPGRVSDDILSKWSYNSEQSKRWHERDRSAIYGGFFTYQKQVH